MMRRCQACGYLGKNLPGRGNSKWLGPDVRTMKRQRQGWQQFGDQDWEWHVMRSERLAESRTAGLQAAVRTLGFIPCAVSRLWRVSVRAVTLSHPVGIP